MTSFFERLRHNLPSILVFCSVCFVEDGFALVIDDGKGHEGVRCEDTSSVPDCPISVGDEFQLLDNVGIVGDGSGVYIGDGWVVTSSHVGCSAIQLRGKSFSPDSSTWSVLANDSGEASEVAIFRIKNWEGVRELNELRSIPLSKEGFKEGQRIVLAAGGYTPSGKKERLVIDDHNGAVLGHYLRPVREVRYGFASIKTLCEEKVKTKGGFETESVVSVFNRGKGMAQATAGDSGGAVFSYNRELSRWELSGCIFAVSHKSKYVPFGARSFIARMDVLQNNFEAKGIVASL